MVGAVLAPNEWEAECIGGERDMILNEDQPAEALFSQPCQRARTAQSPAVGGPPIDSHAIQVLVPMVCDGARTRSAISAQLC